LVFCSSFHLPTQLNHVDPELKRILSNSFKSVGDCGVRNTCCREGFRVCQQHIAEAGRESVIIAAGAAKIFSRRVLALESGWKTVGAEKMSVLIPRPPPLLCGSKRREQKSYVLSSGTSSIRGLASVAALSHWSTTRRKLEAISAAVRVRKYMRQNRSERHRTAPHEGNLID